MAMAAGGTAQGAKANIVVFVKGDKSLDYQVVAKAIDIAHGAGIDKIGLLTPKIEEGL